MDQAYYEFELKRQRRLSTLNFVWLPIGKAIAYASEAYKVEFKLDNLEARAQAQAAIWHRLENGHMTSRSNFMCFANYPNNEVKEYKLGYYKEFSIIPLRFWEYLRIAKKIDYCDWLVGDFCYHYSECESMTDVVNFGLFGSARDVEVALHDLPLLQSWPKYNVNRLRGDKTIEVRGKSAAVVQDKLPRVSESVLFAWWNNLDENCRNLPQDDLWQLAKASFPRNSIARDRIRALDPGRKPGPKQFSGK